MKSSPILVAIFLCAASSTSIAQNTDDSTRPSISASEFVEKAGTGGLAEVEMGELGVQKATNGQVKAFAKRIVTDHTKANEQLVAVIKGKGLEVPSSQSAMHKAMMDKFRASGRGQGFRPRLHGADGQGPQDRYRIVRDRRRRCKTGCRATCLRKEHPADVARPSETGSNNREQTFQLRLPDATTRCTRAVVSPVVGNPRERCSVRGHQLGRGARGPQSLGS